MCSDLASFPLVNHLSSPTITSQASPVVCPRGAMEGTCRKGARVVMREGGRDEVAVDE